MLELSADKYLNKAGLVNADSRIIKVGLRVFTFLARLNEVLVELLHYPGSASAWALA